MTAETLDKLVKTFKYSFPTCTNENVLFKLEIPVEIPHNGSTGELVQRFISMFKIPVYLEEEISKELATFVENETKGYYNERDEKLLMQFKNGEINVEGVIKSWEKLFKDNVMEFAEQKGTSDEEVFAAAYHKLVHSPALETILQVENSYATTIVNTMNSRDEDIKRLTERQTEEMEQKMRLLNTFITEEEINALAAKHFDEQSLVAGRWGSELDALSQTQRSEYRSWLMQTLEEYQSSSELNTPSNSPLATFSPVAETVVDRPLATPDESRLEESFTIHLGSQLKQTHNIRIVAMDMMDLCTVKRDAKLSSPCRLGLYSWEVCGALWLQPASTMSEVSVELRRAAAASAECHFADFTHQLDSLTQQVIQQAPERRAGGALLPGDVYVTRHSNMADVHVIFHMVVDDTLRHGDINSRHPAILGLRNVLKAACNNDVTTLSLPVLLTHHITDEMTLGWCIRRAELVLKCVKGFMLETAGGGGAELRYLRLLLPKDVQPPLFHALAALLPTIFRLSNPLKFKAN